MCSNFMLNIYSSSTRVTDTLLIVWFATALVSAEFEAQLEGKYNTCLTKPVHIHDLVF